MYSQFMMHGQRNIKFVLDVYRDSLREIRQVPTV